MPVKTAIASPIIHFGKCNHRASVRSDSLAERDGFELSVPVFTLAGLYSFFSRSPAGCDDRAQVGDQPLEPAVLLAQLPALRSIR
jgi:hypothetical protein